MPKVSNLLISYEDGVLAFEEGHLKLVDACKLDNVSSMSFSGYQIIEIWSPFLNRKILVYYIEELLYTSKVFP